jgi:hypothetical protein
MALTALQRKRCRLVAGNRTDLDLFHDTDEAVAASWDADRHLFRARRFSGAGRARTRILAYHGELFKGDAEDARRSLAEGEILFHADRIKGAFPRVIESRCPPPGK